MSDFEFKDVVLDRIAETGNVAQFVSFDGHLGPRFSRIRGYAPNHRFQSLEEAITTILDRSPEQSVNVRTFERHNAKSREFVYGLTSAAEVLDRLRAFSSQGLTTIVNETVDVNDGGVSGVAYGDLIEFAPGDTPRCVEKPGTAALPRDLAMRLFDIVYRIRPALPQSLTDRVEFSIHPLRRGYHHDHTILWEIEPTAVAPAAIPIRWPNRFSRLTGDKAFGLLMASLIGCDVPDTTVFPRRLAPFTFGSGGTPEPWIRTCPTEQVPGKFTTARGWLDPFALMAAEDPDGTRIASILHQRGIGAVASGAAGMQADGNLLVEGVIGFGDRFMAGAQRPEPIPAPIANRIRTAYDAIERRLGPARFEWVDDGTRTWIVQLHCGATVSSGHTIVPGDPATFRRFDVRDGLDRLRALIDEAANAGDGIVVVGDVGITSHVGDVLRKAGVPSRLEPALAARA